eukprot:CAMPEP_0202698690 /NCGR_PEP_ID=MMETSP1385-20130828/11935_1 /ASSEMBLY_ACC=CAM_ASM_000861 /TAXON_ID=933848 /ORGANISM="Elphidium margaritaceum" /LENGTH=470 /DNA_ID=CAMNT_0049355455 /DNA_START=49 /DNA_END=1458 /DNA_ORIENTATION=-
MADGEDTSQKTTTAGKMELDEANDEEKDQKETKGDTSTKMAVDHDDDEEEEKVADAVPTKDIEEKVSIIVAETQSSSASDRLSGGIERLLYLEKKQRQSEHEANTLFIAKSILDLCRQCGDFNMTVEQIAILSRRRSQFRRVVMRLVQYSMQWLDDDGDGDADWCHNKSEKLKLIHTLIAVTEGKIFVEVERARLTRRLATIKERDEHNVAEACDILQELQIETFGSMRKKEKCDFLLEQFRLNLAKKDFIRAVIVRNKITHRILKNLYELEVKYWNLSLILYYHHERQFLSLAKAYFRLKELLPSTAEQLQALSNGVLALVLAPFGHEQNDLLHRTLAREKKLLEQLPMFRQLLTLLTTKELIEWPLDDALMAMLTAFKFVGVVDEQQSDLMTRLKEKAIEHNVRVVAEYYQRISTKRLATFLAIDVAQTESYVSRMVTDKEIFARINRLNGVIRFKEKQYPNATLNAW